jgi:hypothetical protein
MAETCITNWYLLMKTVVNDKLCIISFLRKFTTGCAKPSKKHFVFVIKKQGFCEVRIEILNIIYINMCFKVLLKFVL